MSTIKVRRIDFSADEWLSGTLELSDADRGIYITVCALIYSRGERVDCELVARHSKSHGNAVRASLDRLEKAGKIVRNGSEIGQKRCENELEIAQKRSRNASENGVEGNRIKALHAAAREKEKTLTINHQPSTIREDDANASSGAREGRKNGNAGRGSRIATDWRPRDEDYAWALAEHGIERGWADRITVEFVDYWADRPGAGGAKVCWWRTWRNRIRQVAERDRGGPRGRSGGDGSGASRIAAALDRVVIASDLPRPH